MIDVVVPTYKRPASLERCIQGLLEQQTAAERIVVVHQEHDRESVDVLDRYSGTAVVPTIVTAPGQVAAMREGVRTTSAPLVAFTDDDAVPASDWLHRIERHFSDRSVGAVGGRDIIDGTPDGRTLVEPVGRVGRWGRVKGNHHRGAGPARDVDILKGVNMAFRREALAIPMGLRGAGAEPHNDAAMSLYARMNRWRLVYDPDVIVYHYPARRPIGPDRGQASAEDVCIGAYNLTSVLLATSAVPTWRRAVFAVCIGDRAAPGVARVLWSVATESRDDRRDIVRRWKPTLIAQAAAFRAHLHGSGVGFVAMDEHGQE